jgi:hypothetical protein
MKLKLSTLITAVVFITAGATSFAAAASLSVASATFGAGRTAVAPCDSDGFVYTHTLDASHNVASVTVSSINTACSGATLQVTLTDGANVSLGNGSVALPASGFTGAATVTVTGTAPSANVAAYRVAIS